MSKLLKVTVLALLFAVLWGAAGEVQATVKVGARYLPKFEPLSYVKGTGEVKLKITIQRDLDDPQAPWDEVTLTAYGVDLKYKGDTARLDIPYCGFLGSKRHEYYGDSSWVARFDAQGYYSTTFHLTIPDNSSSCFAMLFEFGESYAFHRGVCFSTVGDTLETFQSYSFTELQLDRQDRRDTLPSEDYERAKREWKERQEQLERFKGKGTTGPVMNPEDSALVDSLSDMGKRQLGRMRMLERTPLTDQDRQVLAIDGRWYERKRGETKFRHIPGKTKEEIRADAQRYSDSLAANPPNNVYDVILDLRDPKDYEFASSLIDSLISTEEPGFYRAVVPSELMEKLRENGIEARKTVSKLSEKNNTKALHNKPVKNVSL